MITNNNLIGLRKIELLALVFSFCSLTISKSNAQQNIRDFFLVETISRYDNSSNYATATFIYDTDNKLLSRKIMGKMVEYGQLRDLSYIDEFEYENGLVSKIKIQDLTHFMFSQEIHFLYNLQRELIRKETWINSSMIGHTNYYYENGRIVSVHSDTVEPFEFDTFFYNEVGNVSKRTQVYPQMGSTGNPLPGEYITRELYYEYDNHPKPNFGIDYLYGYQPFPWLGSTVDYEILLSYNNLTKAVFQHETYNYKYNNHGLPETLHKIFDPIGPQIGNIFTITYKQIGQLSITDISIPKINIYPNPTENSFFVEQEKFSTIILYDMLGREIINQNINGTSEINMTHLPKGVYNVKVVSDNGLVIENSKIVKK